MKKLDVLVLVYAILVLGLAIEAYLTKNSLPSLIGGGAAGILEIFFLALSKTNPRVGRIGSAVVALLVLGRFLPAMLKEPKWSNVVLVASSLIVVVALVGGHFLAQRAKAS